MRDFIYYCGFIMFLLIWIGFALDVLAGILWIDYRMITARVFYDMGSPLQFTVIFWLVTAAICTHAKD